VLSAAEHLGASEFQQRGSRAVAMRAAVMGRVARLSEPLFGLAKVRPDSMPLSMLWVPRGSLLVRRRVERGPPDVVLATGPPIAGLIAARAGLPPRVPLVMELRDLWAGNPAFDAGGRMLSRVESWLLGKARRVIACSPEAVSDLRLRHPRLDQRVVEIPNGFDPEITSIAAKASRYGVSQERSPRTHTLLHSGTLTAARPIAPLVRALQDARVADSFRIVLHGYLSPTSQREVQWARRESRVPIEVLAPSSWPEAVNRIAETDAGLVTQARAAGDETAIASKIYEYLALARPVLCITDGGASEALLRRMKADELCARLDAPETIVAALLRLREGKIRAPSHEVLEPYSRRALAGRIAALLEDVASGG
jgi:hypothetical protein